MVGQQPQLLGGGYGQQQGGEFDPSVASVLVFIASVSGNHNDHHLIRCTQLVANHHHLPHLHLRVTMLTRPSTRVPIGRSDDMGRLHQCHGQLMSARVFRSTTGSDRSPSIERDTNVSWTVPEE